MRKELWRWAEELSKEIKSESDLADLTRIFVKATVERV